MAMGSNPNALDWDDEIGDADEYVLLEEGDYEFTVAAMAREHYDGGAKYGPCNRAALTLRVDLPDGTAASVREGIILHTSFEWKIAAFFRCIGLKKRGERLRPDWGKVVGRKGKAHFVKREYQSGKETRTANGVERFYDPGAGGPALNAGAAQEALAFSAAPAEEEIPFDEDAELPF